MSRILNIFDKKKSKFNEKDQIAFGSWPRCPKQKKMSETHGQNNFEDLSAKLAVKKLASLLGLRFWQQKSLSKYTSHLKKNLAVRGYTNKENNLVFYIGKWNWNSVLLEWIFTHDVLSSQVWNVVLL